MGLFYFEGNGTSNYREYRLGVEVTPERPGASRVYAVNPLWGAILRIRGVAPTMQDSDHESLKLSDDAANKIRHTIECFKNRLTSDNLRLSERYVKSELKILMRFSAVCGCGNINDLIASFQRHRSFGECDFPSGTKNDSPIVESGHDSGNQAMLVPTVKLMDVPQSVVPTHVRLYRTEQFFRTGAHLVYFSLTNGRCVLLATLRTIADREISVFVRAASTSLDKLPREMIQRTSQVVDGISDYQCEVCRDRLNSSDLQSYVTNCRLFLDAKCIRLRVAEGTDGGIQITDVLFGPFNFQADSVDSGHALSLSKSAVSSK